MLYPTGKTLPVLLTCIFLFVFTIINAQGTGRLSGKVVDRATQKPLAGISVLLQDSTKGTTTDSLGGFLLTKLDIKTYNLTFTGVGYKPQTYYNLVVTTGNEINMSVEMEPDVTSLSEVVVRSGRRTAAAATLESPLSVQRLTTEEIRSNPGGNFDISKVIQTLPGVGGGIGGGGFRNDII